MALSAAVLYVFAGHTLQVLPTRKWPGWHTRAAAAAVCEELVVGSATDADALLGGGVDDTLVGCCAVELGAGVAGHNKLISMSRTRTGWLQRPGICT